MTVGVESTVERRRIEIEVAADVAVRVGGFAGAICTRSCERGDAPRIDFCYFPDQVWAIQEISLQAVIVVGVNRERLTGLKCGDDVGLPSLNRCGKYVFALGIRQRAIPNFR
jgi:hypothetical protein